MIIASDTSPINYLVLIGEIEILQKLSGQVIIPQAVYYEQQDPHTPQQVKDWIDSAPAWIEIRQADLSFYCPAASRLYCCWNRHWMRTIKQ